MSGATYVTYLPPDRNLYKGDYSQTLKKHQGGKPNEKMIENTYTLKQDLNIPSRAVLKKAYQKVVDNEELKKEAVKATAKMFIESRRLSYVMNADNPNDEKEIERAMKRDVKPFTKMMLDHWGNYPPDEVFSMVARSLGPANPAVKNAVIKELKSKGYNAMVDEASVGGITSPREGVEPLIIFDGAGSLEKVSEKKISRIEQRQATNRYQIWWQEANKSKYAKEPW